MKKRIKTLVFITAAAVLMIAAYVIYKAATVPPERAGGILLFEASGIQSISYEYEGEVLAFVKQDGVWVYERDREYPLNTAYLRDMENALLTVTATQRLEEGSAEEYGLADPSCVITAVADDGNQFRCELGNDNDTANIVYARISGGIYALGDGFSKRFRHSLLDMAMKGKLLDIEASGVTTFSLENGNGGFSLTQYPDGVPGGWSKALTWVFSDGSYGDTELMKQLIRTVAEMRPASCVSYKPDENDIEAFGLKEPACTISIGYKSGRLTIQIGRKNEDGLYAVWLPDTKLVYAMEPQIPEALLQYRQQDFLNRYVFLLQYAEIASIQVDSGAVSKSIDFADENTAWDFYYALSAMRAEGFADEAEPDTGGVVLTVSMKETNVVHTLSFAAYNEDFYSVRFMDDNIRLVNRRDVERLLSLAGSN